MKVELPAAVAEVDERAKPREHRRICDSAEQPTATVEPDLRASRKGQGLESVVERAGSCAAERYVSIVRLGEVAGGPQVAAVGDDIGIGTRQHRLIEEARGAQRPCNLSRWSSAPGGQTALERRPGGCEQTEGRRTPEIRSPSFQRGATFPEKKCSIKVRQRSRETAVVHPAHELE